MMTCHVCCGEWVGGKDDPCPFCEIQGLQEENKRLREGQPIQVGGDYDSVWDRDVRAALTGMLGKEYVPVCVEDEAMKMADRITKKRKERQINPTEK